MKTIKPVVAPFMALILALLWAAIPVPVQASGLTLVGYHDDGVGSDGNHYFETYWESSDSAVDCSPYSGTDGYITVDFFEAKYNNGRGWVQANDVFRSYAGVSGFSHHECQVNVYAVNGAGQREVFVSWTLNGNTQFGNPEITLTF